MTLRDATPDLSSGGWHPSASPAPLPGLTPQSVPLDLKSKPTKQGLLVPLKRRTEKVAIVQSLLEPTVITTLAAKDKLQEHLAKYGLSTKGGPLDTTWRGSLER